MPLWGGLGRYSTSTLGMSKKNEMRGLFAIASGAVLARMAELLSVGDLFPGCRMMGNRAHLYETNIHNICVMD